MRRAIVVVWLIAGAASVAAADPVPAAARRAEERAVAAGRHGDWATALHQLNVALDAAPGWPDALYLRGAAYAELARAQPSELDGLTRTATYLEKASADFEAYLDYENDSSQRRAIERAVATYHAREVEVQDARQKILDDQAAAEKQRIEDARRARQAQIDEAARVAREARERAASHRHAGWIVTGIALGAGGLAGVAAYLGAHTNDNIAAGGYSSADDISSAASFGDAYNIAAWTSAGTGAVLFGIGLSLIIANPDPGPPVAPSTSALPRVQGFSLSGSF